MKCVNQIAFNDGKLCFFFILKKSSFRASICWFRKQITIVKAWRSYEFNKNLIQLNRLQFKLNIARLRELLRQNVSFNFIIIVPFVRFGFWWDHIHVHFPFLHWSKRWNHVILSSHIFSIFKDYIQLLIIKVSYFQFQKKKKNIFFIMKEISLSSNYPQTVYTSNIYAARITQAYTYNCLNPTIWESEQ